MNLWTSQAAKGAAMTPPIMKADTQSQFTSAQPREMKKPIEAETAIANSLVSTVPTTFLALIPFLLNRTGVAIGPHPPPLLHP